MQAPPPSTEIPDDEIEREHAELGLPPMEEEVARPGKSPLMQVTTYLIMAVLVGLAAYLLFLLFGVEHERTPTQIVSDALHDRQFWLAAAVGLLAQMVDGALGMAYGLTASSFLLATGASPLSASGAAHLAEVFTTGISGVSHLRMGNVNRKLFLSLVIPGVIGGLIGTYVLGNIDGKLLKPWISLYLLLMGLYVLVRAFRRIILVKTDVRPSRVVPLALFGSFMDTTGGGGWGPIVTTSLVGAGHDPRTTIGSVNFAEFFLTVTVSAAFFSILESSIWLTVTGLVLGGMFAAPFAAYVTRHVKTRYLLVLVGTLISSISVYNLVAAFSG
ncbi:MAG TPA: sulfite exporter TauE/SafE family protein [Steroidobacteraceae bacterium]|nr:sulfite exporter TauE/SafE family protein [Steroidobacteraceae bacterium]